MNENSRLHWRVLGVLLVLGLLGVAAAIRLQITMLPIFSEPDAPPIAVVWIAGLVQSGIMLGVMCWIGLFLARRVGIQPTPLLNYWFGNTSLDRAHVQQSIAVGFVSGLIAGFVVLAGYTFVFEPITGISQNLAAEAPWYIGLPAAFLYGGITEELLMRLFLMTLLVWLLAFLLKNAEGKPAVSAFWGANIISTVLFGLGHLPTVAMTTTITPAIVIGSVVLNSVGLLYGYLYWKRGIESAMIAHMSTHIGLTLIGSLLMG